MIARVIKRAFRESFCGTIYYKVKRFPPIRIFFDFDYAAALWRKSLIKKCTGAVTKKIFPNIILQSSPKSENVFAFLVSLCPFFGVWSGNYYHIILITAILSAYFLFASQDEGFKTLILYEGVLTGLVSLFVPFSVLLYIMSAEAGITLFFVVKVLDKRLYEKVLLFSGLLWLFGAAFLRSRSVAEVVALMPYAIAIFCKGKVRRYIYGTFILGIGFYALANGGGTGLLGGAMEILLMIIFGEWWLILPAVITAPWIVSFAVRVIKNGVFSERIIETGLFFWRYGFKGVSFDYSAVNFSYGYGKIIFSLFGVIVFMFFWYVLRSSRIGVLDIFKRRGGNQGLLRAGTASVIGFSIYTFFTKEANLSPNIILYLWVGALLKRAGYQK